jgi:hypothetical protein
LTRHSVLLFVSYWGIIQHFVIGIKKVFQRGLL